MDILRNVAYIGKTYSISRARREGDLIDAAWDPIVSEELFAAAQRALDKRKFGGRQGPPLRSYAFSRLLICSRCKRTMRAKTNHFTDYYFCRDDVAPEERCPGASHAIREDKLLPWADQLFQRLDAIAPARPEAERRVTSSEAVRQVEGQIERLTAVYVRFGQKSEAEYEAELRGLEALRDQLQAATPIKPTIRLDGLHDAWVKANASERRALLGLLFDGLWVEDDQIVAWIPRSDRKAEVIAIMEQAMGETVPFGGKGGIRTHEGASHPLPA